MIEDNVEIFNFDQLSSTELHEVIRDFDNTIRTPNKSRETLRYIEDVSYALAYRMMPNYEQFWMDEFNSNLNDYCRHQSLTKEAINNILVIGTFTLISLHSSDNRLNPALCELDELLAKFADEDVCQYCIDALSVSGKWK
jgi:hypothetical protein